MSCADLRNMKIGEKALDMSALAVRAGKGIPGHIEALQSNMRESYSAAAVPLPCFGNKNINGFIQIRFCSQHRENLAASFERGVITERVSAA
jgi:hypothetical protein